MSLVRVDLPEPDGPTTPIVSPGRMAERNVFQDLGRARTVAEADAAKFDRAARRRRQQARRRREFGRRVEDIAQALDRDLHLLEVLPDLRQAQDRLDRLRSDHVEGDKRADGQLAVDHRLGAEQKQRRGRQLADVLDGELAAGAQHRRGEARLDIGCELLLPLRAHDRLDRRAFHRVDADDRLDQELLAGRAAIEFLLDQIAQRRPHGKADHHVERNPGEHDQGQRPRIGEQDADEHEGEHEVERREQSLSGEEAADRLQFPHPGDRLPGRPGLEIGNRQAEKMGEQALAELDVDPVGGVGQRIGAQILKRHVEQADGDKPADEHEQGLVAAMGQHLVDHHLEEQRRRESENLHEQRGRQHMAERTAIPPDGGQEPAHAELARIDAGAADPASDEQRLPADVARKVFERGLLDGVADRIDQPAEPRRIAAAEHHERAARHADDRRRGQHRQPLGGDLRDQARLQSDEPGGADEIGFIGRAGAERQLARDLHRIGADPVIGRDPAQSAQPRIERRPLAERRRRSLHHRRSSLSRAVRRGSDRT